MKNFGSYPSVRLRRNRKTDWSRRLVSENNLSTNDLIWPIFLREGKSIKEPVKSMPGVYRYTVDLLEKAGVHKRLQKEGFQHDGIFLSAKNNSFRIDFKKLVNKSVTVYGQTELTTDLYNAREKSNGIIFNSVKNVMPCDLKTNKPYVTFKFEGVEKKVFCDFVAGCDGFHGVSRQVIPKKQLKISERIYPFGWLGVLSETPPVNNELIYANHETGFALASMRNKNLSRYYIQTSIKDKIEQWDDKNFWLELKKRLPFEASEKLITGPSIEKSIAPLGAEPPPFQYEPI